jgi:hypothetical protein
VSAANCHGFRKTTLGGFVLPWLVRKVEETVTELYIISVSCHSHLFGHVICYIVLEITRSIFHVEDADCNALFFRIVARCAGTAILTAQDHHFRCFLGMLPILMDRLVLHLDCFMFIMIKSVIPSKE